MSRGVWAWFVWGAGVYLFVWMLVRTDWGWPSSLFEFFFPSDPHAPLLLGVGFCLYALALLERKSS